MAKAEKGTFVLIATHCGDRELHRSRIEGRQRSIPNWDELSWDSVLQSLGSWVDPDEADLRLDSANPWEDSLAEIINLLTALFEHD